MTTQLTFKTAETNQTPESCAASQCGCPTFWSLLQQKSYVLLSNQTVKNQYHLEAWYEQRARRIAAVYARIYLETDKDMGANPRLKGRFYWMGLGAFASKTVAATFDSWLTRTGYQGNKVTANFLDAPKSVHIFAKGNLWLFMDVAPWHWAWAVSPGSFELCKGSRNADSYVSPVKKALNALPWASTALPGVRGFRLTKEIRDAFALLPEIEKQKPFSSEKIKKDQFTHLKIIAVQEQKNILQGICWNHPWMQSGARAQRFWRKPKTFIRFHSNYDEEMNGLFGKSDKERYGLPEDPFSYAPKNMKAEEYDSRMDWILAVAKKYHNLMIDPNGNSYVEGHLRNIAGWINSSKEGETDGYSNDPQGNQ
ncbi:DUF2515 family protein [Neisseria dumasiana]|uniref:Uncharacterized protein n=1 Tax=Neisseria dumasiana TaxID=1931275 RepID=A0ABX3WNS7_9NEIS|nr:hypothetical protein [Neisseria dumasiana]OSI35834.1 hypothetical protein BV913_04160 [Neisseria dumasiana]UOO85300.1 hypothetical protein LVJ88_04780 [Neisseria dumasiana]